MAEVIQTTPFNFEELYDGLKTKFEDAGYDIEEGSNTSQLITAMTYLTSMLNVNTAVNINETILPYATRRNNALQDARALGYEIQHKQSYIYKLTIEFDENTDYTIPKFEKFSEGGHDYYYLGQQIEFPNIEAGDQISINVVEGKLFKYETYEDLNIVTGTIEDESGNIIPQYFIDIPFIDIENDGIEAYLSYYDEYGNLVSKEEWKKSDVFMVDGVIDPNKEENILDKKFIRLDDIEHRTPRIYFKFAGIGDGIRENTIVNLNVLQSSGADGAMINSDDAAGISTTLGGCTIVESKLIGTGADEESLQSIKDNAPKFYNSANRAVTKSDYEAFCNRQSTVDTSLVWGGDDEYPKSPGHIWFSFFPAVYERNFLNTQFNYEYLLEDWGDLSWNYDLEQPDPSLPLDDYTPDHVSYITQVNNNDAFYNERYLLDTDIKSYQRNEDNEIIQPGVWDVIENYKIPTLIYHNRHPIYLDFEYDLSILKYNIADAKEDVHANVFSAIDRFFTGVDDAIYMERFETEYFHSSLKKRIDTVLSDITGFNIDIMTRLLLTMRNISQENNSPNYRDIFIPMAIPFETYFDDDGYLLYDKLPNIDTPDFIQYNGETGQDLFVDWTKIQDQIDAEEKQNLQELIILPIKVKMNDHVHTLSAGDIEVEFTDFDIVPDDPRNLDTIDDDFIDDDWLGSQFLETKIVLNNNGSVHELVYGTDWTYTYTTENKITNKIILTGSYTILEGDTLTISGDRMCGKYFVFNSYKKYVIAQLYVDARLAVSNPFYNIHETTETDEENADGSGSASNYLSVPKSYLTTTDNNYISNETPEIDVEYYFTTTGFSIRLGEDDADQEQGNFVKIVSPSLYEHSPIKIDLFRKNRYLNFNYESPNFQVLKNVMPRLKRVTFEQGV